MCYLYRIYQMESRPLYQLTAYQKEELDGLIQLAQQAEDKMVEIDTDNERDENDDGDEGSQRSATPPSIPPELSPIQRQYLRVCISFLDHQVHSGHYRNAVVSVLAVLEIDADYSTWLPAENYTPKLSAVIKLARMMVILQVYDSTPNSEETAIVQIVGR